jgi:hypothetical protein
MNISDNSTKVKNLVDVFASIGALIDDENLVAMCRNPSFGFATKAKGLQGCGPRGSPGITSHTPRSVGKCEGVNLHTPKATPSLGGGVPMESQWSPKTSESGFRGQNSMACENLCIIEKILERRCLKWARIAHLDIRNTSYGQKKGNVGPLERCRVYYKGEGGGFPKFGLW